MSLKGVVAPISYQLTCCLLLCIVLETDHAYKWEYRNIGSRGISWHLRSLSKFRIFVTAHGPGVTVREKFAST